MTEKILCEMTSYRSGPLLSGTLMLALYCGWSVGDRICGWAKNLVRVVSLGPCVVSHTHIKRVVHVVCDVDVEWTGEQIKQSK